MGTLIVSLTCDRRGTLARACLSDLSRVEVWPAPRVPPALRGTFGLAGGCPDLPDHLPFAGFLPHEQS